MSPISFEQEVAFLRGLGPVEVLASPTGGRVAVSGRLQGRVMTSAVEAGGASLGFVNHPFLEAGRFGTPFDNVGGEDRFWLAPEAGQHGFFFAPGAPFDLASWQVPHALQEGEWLSRPGSGGAVVFDRRLSLLNHQGARFDVAVERTIHLLAGAAVAARFGFEPPPGSRWVCFETVNRITNAGAWAWTRATGRPSVWILNQYPTSPDAIVVIPLVPGEGPVVNDRYFGKIPADRLAVRERDGYLLFKGDGRHRGKIGVAPARTTSALATYRPHLGLFTAVRYDKPAGAHDYVNNLWETQADTCGGDAVNSFNDGPVGGQPPLAPFYELETTSPAATLAPGESLVHRNTTLHVVDAPAALDAVSRHVLGVPLDALRF